MEPRLECKKPGIKAHSIPNSRAFGFLHQLGKVLMMEGRIVSGQPQVSLRPSGRNEASTFAGFCSEHDAKIFREIDMNEIDPKNSLHLSLIDFRAVTREVYVVWENAIRTQRLYVKRVEQGRDTADVTSPLGLHATEEMLRAYAMYQYRHDFSLSIVQSNYDLVDHDTFDIQHEYPTIAVSACFSFERIINTNFTGVVLNVLPMNKSKSLVCFSYLKKDTIAARSKITNILNTEGDIRLLNLSRLIIAYTENFALNPRFVKTWGTTKKLAVERAFRETLLGDARVGSNSRYMLFHNSN
jgi:hypothetical protein